MTDYEFVLCHVSSGTDLEDACRIELVDFDRFVQTLETNESFRRQWMMAEALWRLIKAVRCAGTFPDDQ